MARRRDVRGCWGEEPGGKERRTGLISWENEYTGCCPKNEPSEFIKNSDLALRACK